MVIDGLSYKSNTENNKLFSRKEYNNELNLNWYDFHARNYDPQLVMWFNVDPLAENYHNHTPYNYCFSNPVNFTDPTGMGPVTRDTDPGQIISGGSGRRDYGGMFEVPSFLDLWWAEGFVVPDYTVEQMERMAEKNPNVTHYFNNGSYVGSSNRNLAALVLDALNATTDEIYETSYDAAGNVSVYGLRNGKGFSANIPYWLINGTYINWFPGFNPGVTATSFTDWNAQASGPDLGTLSTINSIVGLTADWLNSEFKSMSKQVFKYGQSYIKDGKHYVKTALQITRESKIANLKAAKFFGKLGTKTIIANTVINGVEFGFNPTPEQGVWSSGMIGLGIVGTICPPVIVYSIVLDQVGMDGIQQVWEHEMHMYREYGVLPRP